MGRYIDLTGQKFGKLTVIIGEYSYNNIDKEQQQKKTKDGE